MTEVSLGKVWRPTCQLFWPDSELNFDFQVMFNNMLNFESHIKVKNDHRGKFSNLSNWKEEAWKKSRLQLDSNSWPPRHRCDALPTELWRHTLVARPIYWVHISREEWNNVRYIWNNSYIWTAVVAVKVKNDLRSKFSNLSNWKEEAWKNQGFDGIRTRDLRDTGAMLYQLSYEATHWERGQFIEFISPVRSSNPVINICMSCHFHVRYVFLDQNVFIYRACEGFSKCLCYLKTK